MTKGDVVGAWGRGHLEYVKPTARLITFSSSLSFLSPWPEHFQRGSRHGRGGTRPDSRSEHTRIQAAQAIRRPKWVSRPRSAEISWRAAPDRDRPRSGTPRGFGLWEAGQQRAALRLGCRPTKMSFKAKTRRPLV